MPCCDHHRDSALHERKIQPSRIGLVNGNVGCGSLCTDMRSQGDRACTRVPLNRSSTTTLSSVRLQFHSQPRFLFVGKMLLGWEIGSPDSDCWLAPHPNFNVVHSSPDLPNDQHRANMPSFSRSQELPFHQQKLTHHHHISTLLQTYPRNMPSMMSKSKHRFLRSYQFSH